MANYIENRFERNPATEPVSIHLYISKYFWYNFEMEKIVVDNFMQMSPWDFDQSPSGWRSLDALGKKEEAVEVIRQYITKNKDKIENFQIMHFHIGQLLASIGPVDYEEAAKSFELSFQNEDSDLWNAYVSATIGFLRGDLDKINQSILSIENSSEEDKRGGNLGIIRNFKKALETGERDYEQVYSWPRD